ncbi:hypothetical protein CC78DRAFT_83114 [Lojkania enalia]|uniref:Uncharacterized protein n=1 Tax=Lojkania enalia TaxID=147567 RepID=A0A9P4MVM0_9PLEO|nr:hypothetical protein CC78DRAFT_83114 [Didymosphaeria enalia]
MPLILAEELDTLTVQGIQEWDRRAGDGNRIYIDVIDKHNLTDKRLERLMSLVRERDELSESRAVNADELNTKLRQISPRCSPTPSDAPSTPVTAGAELTQEERIERTRYGAYENYRDLKDVGGRPSREINPDPGPCPLWKSDIDKRYHVPDHWNGELWRTRDELTRWLDFRWHQFRKRGDPKIFNKYKEAVHKHRQVKDIGWAAELQLGRQTKLDEWWEYYLYEHRKRGALEKELDRAKRELEPAKERMKKAKRNGSVGVPETAFSGRWGELIRYDEKILQAQKEVEMAQKRLDVLWVEESLSTAERNMLTEQAEEELESAQKRLEAEKSDELDQLSKESERETAQSNLAGCQGKVNYANARLEQLDTLLEWIAGQSTEVATEYASSSWIEREFPQIAAKYAPSNRDSQSNGTHQGQGQAVLPYLRPSPNEPARKASQLAGNSTRCRRRSARERSPLSQVQPSKVSKPSQRRRRPLNQKRSTIRDGVWPPEGHANDVVQIEEQGPPKVALRRSVRISQRTRGPAPPSPGLVRATKKTSQRCLDSVARRSARISDRTEKIRSLGSDADVKPTRSSTTAGQKSARHITVHTNIAYSGTPQGISKTRRWKTTPKKGKNV